MKIFLGSLEHDWEKVGTWAFPLGVASVAAYLFKFYPKTEIKLFKSPAEIISAIKAEKPTVVGLSYYCWVNQLNKRIFEITKQYSPDTLTVGGGPEFSSLNANEEGAKKFFSKHQDCDAFVVDSGEIGFKNIIDKFLKCDLDLNKFRQQTIAGCLVNNIFNENAVQIGGLIDGFVNLDSIPSPYLSGLLDEFFNQPYIPIIETNRSCPYECAFCAWGKKSKRVTTFSKERVILEIEYIGQRCTKTKILELADANFGLFPRDADIADKIYECSQKYSYPGYVDICWNKSNPELLLKIIKKFGKLTKYCASMQTLHQPTLDVVKRKNISWSELLKLHQELKKAELGMSTELILGLPLETKESHIETNKRMMDLETEIFNYNLHLLPGTVLDSQESRNRFVRRTAWRLFDMSFGIYEGRKVFDAEENVMETSTMSMADLRSFRFIHFLIQFMWSKKWYYDFLNLFKKINVHPLEVILRASQIITSPEHEINELYKDFSRDHNLELFDTKEELFDYWRREENFARLRSGDYGKLNYLYTYKILLEKQPAFNDFLYQVAKKIFSEAATKQSDLFLKQCQNVLDFSNNLQINLTNDDFIRSKIKMFEFDILTWRLSGHKDDLPCGNFQYEFYLSDTQESLIKSLFDQYKSHSKNLSLRKMSEQIAPENLFYQVRNLNKINL
ncbi:cobalamin B12-binding domain-containing protein [Candidatus Falkowbacteria bacterium]|nr:cobalamin B12-binding domain-containing protein [Candidatus Falkowbacteria bacterium]